MKWIISLVKTLVEKIKEWFKRDDEEVEPKPTPEPEPTPQPPSEDFIPSTRTGAGEWTGNGKFNTFKDCGRKDEKSSSKVIVSGWFNANGWSGGGSEQPSGFCFANKGRLGSHWGLNLTVRPNALVWNSTKGEITASANISTKAWHHVKAEATQSNVKFWLDGKLLKTGTKPFAGLIIQDSGEPLRVGGFECPWPNATWFNQSLNGRISDVSVEMK